ncbi:putative lipid-binding protein AIR1 [Durio zibethinus]|uniref:Lipid-binding protein AIR1 n=1 Tax=Durio zibethinus TaxID=66656 RepID=A0A6P6AHS5_DURZI|nr:putative lipid-binding protein AIR1 [Durio zibethinus]
MASKIKASTALFLSFNLLFFATVSSSDDPYDNDSSNGVGGNSNNGNSQGSYTTTNSRNPVVIRPGDRRNNLNLLGCLVNLDLGNVPTQPCCTLIHGLADVEVALCLCTAIRANVLGINLNLPISLSLLLNNYGRENPSEYICSP